MQKASCEDMRTLPRQFLPKTITSLCVGLLVATTGCSQDKEFSDIKPETKNNVHNIRCDLTTPLMVAGKPSAGKRVKATLPGYEESNVYHSLYLPTDWKPNQRYPVIVEYPGNGTYSNNLGDVCNGKVEECNLGYGISAGQGFIWICLPFVSQDRKQNQLLWWGSVDATVSYCQSALADVCANYGGDEKKVFISGFSRGSIACNYIGLNNDQIASWWCGFICHSHYDGTANWNQGPDQKSAKARLMRLANRPQFISHELSVETTKSYLEKQTTNGKFTYQALPYPNHTDAWVLRDIPERRALRAWVQGVITQIE